MTLFGPNRVLDAGLIPKFINRKHGKENIDFQHQSLEPILSETYGIMVYQEQIMKIAQDLAGYSLGQADLLRRAMGKKKVSEMQRHRTLFVDGAVENGVSAVIAEYSEVRGKCVDIAGFIRYNKEKKEVLSFGKYKNVTLENIWKENPGYFSWINQSDFPLSTKNVMRDFANKMKLNNKFNK